MDVTNGTALNKGKQLPENNYKLSLVTFKDGEKELGSVMVKNGGAATFETPADRTDGADKLVFEKWVTENGGDAEADLSAISGDAVVYAKFRRVFANAITAFDTADIVYGETPAFTATAKYGEAGITFAKEKDAEYKAWGELENHNVGTYYVKASVAATDEYDGAEATKSFEVKKATNAMQLKMAATIKCTDMPEPAATAQHGEVKYTYGKDIDTVQNWDFATARYKDAAGNEIIDARLGYKVKATVEGTENYDGAEATAEFIVIHDFDENGLCKHCRKGQSCISYAEDGEKAYISGYIEGNNPSGEIYPLAKYNNKDVAYVAAHCGWTGMVTKIVLPKSVTDFKGNSFEAAVNLEYISMTGVEHITTGNNFINCSKIKTVIVNKAFNLDNQQFKKHGMTAEAQGIIYVDGTASESTFSFTAPNLNEFITGKVFYKGNATKCLQWNFDENGEIIHGASEHNYVDGKCTRCGEYNGMGVSYKYDEISGTYYVAGYTGTSETVTVLGMWNDGTNGEKKVTFIKYLAFDGNQNIKRVFLHENIISLDGGVFANCPNLEYVSMTGITDLKVTTLQEQPHKNIYGTKNDFTNHNFMNCPKLTTVVVGKNFTVGDAMFMSTNGSPACVNIYTLATGESDGIITLNTANNALLTGTIYYYSETQKAGCWHYDDNGNAELWA